MTEAINADPGVSTPDLMLGFESARRGGSNVHRIVGSSSVDVTLAPAQLRSGRLELFYMTEAAALQAETIHGKSATFTLTDTERPLLGMTYAVTGEINLKLDPTTLRRWILSVGYEQVA